jgi:hypothetical protein
MNNTQARAAAKMGTRDFRIIKKMGMPGGIPIWKGLGLGKSSPAATPEEEAKSERGETEEGDGAGLWDGGNRTIKD